MASKVAKNKILAADTMTEEQSPVKTFHGGIPVGPEEYHRRKDRLERITKELAERDAKERVEAIEAHKEPNLITNFPTELSYLFKDLIETFGPQSVYAANDATTIIGESLPGFQALRTICTEDEDVCECAKEWHSHANNYIRDWFRENGITIADTYDPERRMDMLGWGDHPEVVIDPEEDPNQPCDCERAGGEDCNQCRAEGSCPCCDPTPDPGPDASHHTQPYYPRHPENDEEE